MKEKSNNQIIDKIVKATIRAIFATIGSSYSTEEEKRNYTDEADLEWFRKQFEIRGESYDESKIKIVKERLGYDEEKYDELVTKKLIKCLGVSYPKLCLYQNKITWIEELIKTDVNIEVMAYYYDEEEEYFTWKKWKLVVE